MLKNPNPIMFASSFLSGTAAVSWYSIVQTIQEPTTWATIMDAVVKEIVSDDHTSRSRDKLRNPRQTTSVSKFLSGFRNLVLSIPNMGDVEKWDKFCLGFKY